MAAKWPTLARLKRLIPMINSCLLRLVCPDLFCVHYPHFFVQVREERTSFALQSLLARIILLLATDLH